MGYDLETKTHNTLEVSRVPKTKESHIGEKQGQSEAVFFTTLVLCMMNMCQKAKLLTRDQNCGSQETGSCTKIMPQPILCT